MKQMTKVFSPRMFNMEENWEDFYLELKSVRKGDVFYESDNRNAVNYELKALEDAKQSNGGWMCKVQKMDGEVVNLYVSAMTFSTTYPGPNFFRVPQVLSFIEGKGHMYQIC